MLTFDEMPVSMKGIGFVMKHKEALKFTNKKHTVTGVMSTTFGAISVLFLVLLGIMTIRNHGAAPVQYGAACLFNLLFALTGFISGIVACTRKNTYKFFPVTGIIINVIVLTAISGILYLGVR